MGKLREAKKRLGLAQPARSADARAMEVEGDACPDPSNSHSASDQPLSAHQQRHLERKRLQSEKETLKKARRKVSAANTQAKSKQAAKHAKKQITKNIKALHTKVIELEQRCVSSCAGGGQVAVEVAEHEGSVPLTVPEGADFLLS